MLPQIIAVPFCTTDGVEPSSTTVTFPAGTKGPMTREVEYCVPPDDVVEDDIQFFVVMATILQPQFGLFDDEGSTTIRIFDILDDDS